MIPPGSASSNALLPHLATTPLESVWLFALNLKAPMLTLSQGCVLQHVLQGITPMMTLVLVCFRLHAVTISWVTP